ncbi:hypothetical protein ABTO70_19560, partial [Acinetobacter baumannii]
YSSLENNYYDIISMSYLFLSCTEKNLKYLPESWAESRVGTLGLSWIDDNTYLGVSYTHRHDEYGLPAHSHLYEGCGASAIGIDSRISGLKNYLLSLYTTNFTEPLSYQDSAFLKLPKFP